MTPSTTSGSATIPTVLFTSRYHASPSPLTFWSVISFNGLKCCDSKFRPFTSQSFPPESADTRASFTSPALVGASAKLCRATVAVINKIINHPNLRPCFIQCPLCQTRNCMTFGREKQGRRSPAEFSLTHTMKFHRYAISHPPFYGFVESHLCTTSFLPSHKHENSVCAENLFESIVHRYSDFGLRSIFKTTRCRPLKVSER